MLYDCYHDRVECPKHEGAFDCNSFCSTCEGMQEYCPNGCEPHMCDNCSEIEWINVGG
jgi:hypothetical protein